MFLGLSPAIEAQFNYTDNKNGTCTITGYTGDGGNVVIPGIINGLTNVGIAYPAFLYKTGLQSVIVPDTVRSIGFSAFVGCTFLTNIVFGSGLTNIDFNAFYQCTRLATITLPASMSLIGDGSFSDCLSLTEVYFLGNAPVIGTSVFSSDSHAIVYYLAGTSGWGTSFGGLPATQMEFNYAVNNGAVTITGYIGLGGDVVIPNSINGLPVATIGTGAFYELTNLSKITIPSNVLTISDSAFYGCSNLTGVYFEGSPPGFGANVFENDSNATAYYFFGTAGWQATFSGLPTVQYQFTYVVKTNFVATTSYIGTNTVVDIPSTLHGLPVTMIGDNTFYYHTNLTGVTIPNSITSIGISAFANCSSLRNVFLPDSVTNIGDNAFVDCAKLTNIKFPNGLINIPPGMLDNCPSLTSIKIPDSVTTIGYSAFVYCKGLTNVVIGNNVTNIMDEAFRECFSLTEINIPKSVATIGSWTFNECTNLHGIYFAGNAPVLNRTPLAFDGDTNATIYYLPGATGWSSPFGGLPAILWNPQVAPAGFDVSPNQFGFSIVGSSNLVLVVETSTNACQPVWQPLQTITLTNGQASFADAQWTNYPQRFYRFRSP